MDMIVTPYSDLVPAGRFAFASRRDALVGAEKHIELLRREYSYMRAWVESHGNWDDDDFMYLLFVTDWKDRLPGSRVIAATITVR